MIKKLYLILFITKSSSHSCTPIFPSKKRGLALCFIAGMDVVGQSGCIFYYSSVSVDSIQVRQKGKILGPLPWGGFNTYT